MEAIVQWATILSPIIAILIAVWAIRSSAKDTDRKIKAMRESTAEEVEKLSQLADLQVQALALELELEQVRNRIAAQQAAEESEESRSIFSCNQLDFRAMMKANFEMRKPQRDSKYLTAYIQQLNRLSGKLNEIKQQLKNDGYGGMEGNW